MVIEENQGDRADEIMDENNIDVGEEKNTSVVEIKKEDHETVEGGDSEQSKPVALINNMEILFDQNTERCRKRSEQMKKMRAKLKSEKKGAGNNSVAAIPQEQDPIEVDPVVTHSPCRRRSLPLKLYKESKEKEEKDYLELSITSKLEKLNNINSKDKNEREKSPGKQIELIDEEPEVNVSLLEGEIGGDETINNEIVINNPITAINQNKNSSFIDLKNNLTIQTSILKNKENLTESMKMAMGMYEAPEEKDSNKEKYRIEKKVQSYFDDNNNYVLNEIIEEEYSDYLTDSEFGSKKKKPLNPILSGSLKDKEFNLNLIGRQISFTSGYLDESPKDRDRIDFYEFKKFCSPSPTSKRTLNTSNENDGFIYFNFKKLNKYSLSEINFSRNKKEILNKISHKASKSDVIDARLGIVKIMERIQNKIKMIKNYNKESSRFKKKILLKKLLRNKCKR